MWRGFDFSYVATEPEELMSDVGPLALNVELTKE
jgi:hypothetical protein